MALLKNRSCIANGNVIKASVIIPAYNASRTIARTLGSLLAQTARDFEILIVDDGSTDETPDICKRLQLDSTIPIRVFRQQNKRQSAARNLGIKKAEGKYVIFLDADDLAERDYVEKLVRAAEKDPEIDISCCSYSLLFKDGSGKPRRLPSEPGEQTLPGCEALISLLEEKLEVWSGSALYRRNILLEKDVLYDENMTMGQDIDFRWRAFYHARKVALVPDLLVHYVQHDHSVTRAFDPVRFPPSTWIDPSLFLKYIERQKDKDDRLIALVQGMVIPWFLLRKLRNYVFFGLDELFWHTLNQENTKDVLKRGFSRMVFKSPAIGLKCLFFLVIPGSAYRHYLHQRERVTPETDPSIGGK